jgi:hypothetical protein
VALGVRGPHGDLDAGLRPAAGDLVGVDLGAAGLDVGQVAPRQQVDVLQAG